MQAFEGFGGDSRQPDPKASREPLGFGVRTTLASLDDIIRTTAAYGGKKAEMRLPRLHRLLDLEQTIGPDPAKFPLSDPRHARRGE